MVRSDNDSTASFATYVSRVQAEFRIPVRPVFTSQRTSVSLQTDNAILLNGVKVDILAAACFGVGNGKTVCNDMAQPWRYDLISPLNSFGADRHNAYVDDYEYVAGSGDLDECNGMNRNGSYGYYVITAYPWILAR